VHVNSKLTLIEIIVIMSRVKYSNVSFEK